MPTICWRHHGAARCRENTKRSRKSGRSGCSWPGRALAAIANATWWRRPYIFVAFQVPGRDLHHHVASGRTWQSRGPRNLGENPQGSFRMRHYAKMFGIRRVLR